MAFASENVGRSRTHLAAIPMAHPSCRVEILENPLAARDPELGAEIEEAIHRALRDEDLGPVQVRFRVCQDDSEGLRFICKVENPPRVDGDGAAPAWRWWSPLLETTLQLSESLEEGLRVRRHRLALVPGHRR
jgi:hypothetical protein